MIIRFETESSLLRKSMFVDSVNLNQSSALADIVIKRILSVEDKVKTVLENYTDNIPKLLLFKTRLQNDPTIQIERKSVKPVINVDVNNPQSMSDIPKITANTLVIYVFITNFLKYGIPSSQLTTISLAFTDLLIPLIFKPISSDTLRKRLVPECLIYVLRMYYKDSLTLDHILKHFSQYDNITTENVNILKKTFKEQDESNIMNADRFLRRIQNIIGLEDISQRMLVKYGIPDILFAFDQPFYLYTTFMLSMQWKMQTVIFSSIREQVGKKIFNFVNSLNH